MLAQKRTDVEYHACVLGEAEPSWWDPDRVSLESTEGGTRYRVITIEAPDEGEIASAGDWLVMGVRGEFWVVDDATFTENKRLVEGTTDTYVEEGDVCRCWEFVSMDDPKPDWLAAEIQAGVVEMLVDFGGAEPASYYDWRDGKIAGAGDIGAKPYMVVHASWGDLVCEPNTSYIVSCGPGDCYPVEKGIFDDTYVILSYDD